MLFRFEFVAPGESHIVIVANNESDARRSLEYTISRAKVATRYKLNRVTAHTED